MILNKNLKKIGKYQLLEVIGKGANGIVHKGLDNQTGRSVAIKQVALSEQQLKPVQSEIYLLRELSHQHIVKYIDVLQYEDNCLYIVLEFIEGGSLANLVKKYPLPEHLVRVYIRQVLLGLDYLHQMGVVHRDIKGANILLTKEGIVKLADFGVAIRLNEDHRSFSLAGTPYWMAPEIIESKGEISTSCDIWSLGCTVIELLTGNPPYFDLMQYPALFRIVQDDHPPLPEVSDECKDFLLKCFRKEPEKRARAGQLVCHKWLEDAQNDRNVTEVPAYISFEVKEMLQTRNYEELMKALNRIPTKRLIYHNPHLVLLLNDKDSVARCRFIREMIRGDWETFRYVGSVGLLESVLNISNYQHQELSKCVCQIIVEASELCTKHTDLSLFFTVCLKPLRRLINVATADEALLIRALDNLLKEDIIASSHLTFILCKEGLLKCIVAYFNKQHSSNPAEALRTISMIYKISSIRESHIAAFFHPYLPYLVKYLETVDQLQLLSKVVKTIYNLAKNSSTANELEFEGVLPIMLQLLSRLAQLEIREQAIVLINDLLRTIDTLTAEPNRKNQFVQHKGRSILANCQNHLSARKDLVDNICTLLQKLEF